MNRKTLSTVMMISVIAAGALPAPVFSASAAVAQAPATNAVEHHDGEGEVAKIDRDAGRIELKHGPIQSLGWPAMRMAFRVTDPRLLDGIETGQRVRFTLSRSPDGSLKISELERGN
jgi:Cu/Ag efflux protein CusF